MGSRREFLKMLPWMQGKLEGRVGWSSSVTEIPLQRAWELSVPTLDARPGRQPLKENKKEGRKQLRVCHQGGSWASALASAKTVLSPQSRGWGTGLGNCRRQGAVAIMSPYWPGQAGAVSRTHQSSREGGRYPPAAPDLYNREIQEAFLEERC